MEVPRLRAVTPACPKQALRRAGMGFVHGAPYKNSLILYLFPFALWLAPLDWPKAMRMSLIKLFDFAKSRT